MGGGGKLYGTTSPLTSGFKFDREEANARKKGYSATLYGSCCYVDYTGMKAYSYQYENSRSRTWTDNPSRGEVYNVCSSKGRKLKDVITILERRTGIHAGLEVGKSLLRPLENRALVEDSSKLRKRCGWHPKRGFEASMVDILEYWRSFIA